MGYTAQALRKSHLVGNKFEIVIRHMKNKHLLNFLKEASGIPNFYGLQRFGSARLVTHLVGRQIVKKDFSGAVHTLLSYTTEYDTKFSRELREKCKDPRNYRSVLKNMPRGMDIERLVLISLLSGKNHISSLRSVPINIRRLFVHAYQAFLFNECISSLIKEGQDITRCVAEDLCFELEDVCVLGKLRKFTFGMNQDKIVPATQLVGYAFRNREGRFEKTMFRVLSDEGLTPKDFFVSNMQELSVEGGFRQLPLMVKDLDYDPDYGIKFRLPVGAYATTLLRELIKPANPINAGF
jgi:tRNA pseudouridine13 synthase